jgi:hypothetical protein
MNIYVVRAFVQLRELLSSNKIVTGSQKHRDRRFPPYAFTARAKDDA